MSSIWESLKSGTVRRVLALVIGVALVALSNKFGLGLSEADKAMVTSVIITYILGGNINAAMQAKSEAAKAVPDRAAAIALLSEPPK